MLVASTAQKLHDVAQEIGVGGQKLGFEDAGQIFVQEKLPPFQKEFVHVVEGLLGREVQIGHRFVLT